MRPPGSRTRFDPSDGSLLEVRGVTVRFGGNVALANVDLDASPGRVTGLIGPNGAGKTTLFNVICGLQRPDSGRVRIDGRDVTRLLPYKRARAGLARTFQRLELFTLLDVRSNIRVAADIERRHRRDRSIDPAKVADEIIERVGLGAWRRHTSINFRPGRRGSWRSGERWPRVLACCCWTSPRRGRTSPRPKRSRRCLRDLAADGLAVVLVEHDVRLVLRVSDEVCVLDFGEVLAVGTPEEIQTRA